VFCIDLRTNRDYFTIEHYNRDGECLLHGTSCIFKSSSD